MAAAVPVIAVIASVASTAYTAYTSTRAGREERRERERAAEQQRVRTELEVETAEKRHRRILAAQRAGYAAAGVTLEGSPLLVQMESLKEAEEEITRIRLGGAMEAEQQERLGRLAQRSGYMEAGGEVLRGTGSLLQTGRYYWW